MGLGRLFPAPPQGPHACWTGYFTSRPALKGYVRDTSSVFQASKQIQFFGQPPYDISPANYLYRLERAMGVTQHHDSVSGTSKQHVAYDYARRLAWGREDAQAGNKAALATLTRFAGDYATCDLSNATICPALESPALNTPILVTVWNQQSQNASSVPMRLPAALVSGVTNYKVTGPDGADVTAQLVPASAADSALRTNYYGAAAVPMTWVCFQAAAPALGFANYFLTPVASAAEAPLTHVSRPRTAKLRADQTLTNGIVTLTFAAATGLLSNFADSSTGVNVPLVQTWFYYNSSVGDAPNDGTGDYGQASGAYIMRTNTSTEFPLRNGTTGSVTIITGPVVNEARMSCADADWVTQSVRLWAGAHEADVEMTVGPVPRGPAPQGREIVTRYASNLVTASQWQTDSNIRDMMNRTRDFRPTWPYQVYEPIAGNCELRRVFELILCRSG